MPFSTHHALSESQKRMYALEKEENFRWVARLLSSCPPPSLLTLTPTQRVPASLQLSISELGQFAELVNGAIDVDFVWRNLEQLIRPDYPLEGYDAVRKSRLLRVFHGRVANQRGYIVHRPETRQLVVAFSGTSSFMQALQDLDARLVSVAALKSVSGYDGPPARVHAGFWRLYQGVKDAAIEGLDECLKTVEVDELVVVGHSLGAAISALLVMDLLQAQLAFLPDGLKLRLLTFGSPRVGNAGLKELYTYLVAEHHRKRGETAFEAHAVKGYNDGKQLQATSQNLGLTLMYFSPLMKRCSLSPS